MTESRSDFELLDAWAGGDQAAGRRLYERHFALLFRFLRTKIEEGRDDLLQAVWLACIEGRERIRSRDSFRAYLLQTARFQLYAYYRQRNRNQAIDFDAASVVDLGSSPSRVFLRRQQERLLLEALRRVPLDQQIVLELSFWEELSGPEIAEVLGIPEPTVRTRLHRAIERLRAQMAAFPSSGQRLPDTEDDLRQWALRLREQLGAADDA